MIYLHDLLSVIRLNHNVILKLNSCLEMSLKAPLWFCAALGLTKFGTPHVDTPPPLPHPEWVLHFGLIYDIYIFSFGLPIK